MFELFKVFVLVEILESYIQELHYSKKVRKRKHEFKI